ncbi:DUF3891 family protein [Candidatus Roizmanbacteria bacterium]|nr:DUF3891 family protein [Candidatus Roizmanbacteria bacterium]
MFLHEQSGFVIPQRHHAQLAGKVAGKWGNESIERALTYRVVPFSLHRPNLTTI